VPPVVVENVFDVPPSPIKRRQVDAEAEAAPPKVGPPAPEPRHAIVVPRVGQAAPAIAGWTKKRRPRALFTGGARRLVALLQQELLPLR
jgi:hypothetical protein